MGTTVSSLQILGAAEDAVRAAMPKAIVGKWSQRFVTACPGELAFTPLERKAMWLSKKLACTVLSVSLFDGDMLSLALFVSGKRMARHLVDPESGDGAVGNAAAFCAGLGLRETLAPCLKRLLTAADQEEKLGVLAALLGAPLFVRWDEPFETPQQQAADENPLHTWIAEHPLPPKIKNQAHAEVVQEIGERMPDGEGALILRPLSYADEEDAALLHCAKGSVWGHHCTGGEWARWGEDARLELTALHEDGFGSPLYAEADGRLLTATRHDLPVAPDSCCAAQSSTLAADSAGLLPLPLPLTPDGEPAAAERLYLLPDGGFLVLFQAEYTDAGLVREAVAVRYGADGARLWARTGHVRKLALAGDRIYMETRAADSMLLRCLSPDGRELCSVGVGDGYHPPLASGGYLYYLEITGYRKDDILRRFTLDLRPAGSLSAPYMSSLAASPDGSLLFCAGYDSGLAVIDADTFTLRREARSRENYYSPIVDGKNRLWVGSGGFFECYSPDLEPLSRHRLAGDALCGTRNAAGEVMLATFQRSKYRTRVYRFY